MLSQSMGQKGGTVTENNSHMPRQALGQSLARDWGTWSARTNRVSRREGLESPIKNEIDKNIAARPISFKASLTPPIGGWHIRGHRKQGHDATGTGFHYEHHPVKNRDNEYNRRKWQWPTLRFRARTPCVVLMMPHAYNSTLGHTRTALCPQPLDELQDLSTLSRSR